MTFSPKNVFMRNTTYILSLPSKTLGVQKEEQTQNVLETQSSVLEEWGGWKYHKANQSEPHQHMHFSRIAGKWMLWKRQLEMDQVSSTLKGDFWASIVARHDI